MRFRDIGAKSWGGCSVISANCEGFLGFPPRLTSLLPSIIRYFFRSFFVNWRACGLLLLFVGSPAAAAGRFQVTFGSALTASMPAPNVAGAQQQDRTTMSGWIYGVRGRVFGDNSAYVEQTLSGAIANSRGGGWSAEMDFTRPVRRDADATDYWGLNLALGYDHWHTSSSGNVSNPGYDERYGVGFGRVGAVLHSSRYGVSLGGGVKLPFYASGSVGLGRRGVDDLALTPRPDYSLYATVDYRVSERWKLGGYFDSHRFKPSDVIPLTAGGLPVGGGYQPKSQQDSVGIYLNYRF